MTIERDTLSWVNELRKEHGIKPLTRMPVNRMPVNKAIILLNKAIILGRPSTCPVALALRPIADEHGCNVFKTYVYLIIKDQRVFIKLPVYVQDYIKKKDILLGYKL
jgi:hypothetical protein